MTIAIKAEIRGGTRKASPIGQGRKPRRPKLGNFNNIYSKHPELAPIPEFDKNELGDLEILRRGSVPDVDSPELPLLTLSGGDTSDDSPDNIEQPATASETRESTPATTTDTTASGVTIGDDSKNDGSTPLAAASAPVPRDTNLIVYNNTALLHMRYVCYCKAVRYFVTERPYAMCMDQLEMNARAKCAKYAAAIPKSHNSLTCMSFALDWDAHGNYYDVSKQPPTWLDAHEARRRQTKIQPMRRDETRPLYLVDRETKFKILRSSIDEWLYEDDCLRAFPVTMYVCNRPIHVFVDMSNIIIGFYQCIRRERLIPPEESVRAAPFHFKAFATILERGRMCAKRVLAGSKGAKAATPGYLLEAENCGYEMNILQRVQGCKPGRYADNRAFYEDFGAQGFREQGVDEILHLKMVQSLIDCHEPSTIVLATGDAAAAEFSDGFFRNVIRALHRGWMVEVVGWKENMAAAWFSPEFQAQWGFRFRPLLLDSLSEELLAMWTK